RNSRAFPEPNYGQWRRALESSVRTIHRERPVTLTIATANPHVDFQGAYALFKSRKVPFVMDYRDAWRLDVFAGTTLASRRSRIGRLEARYVGAASEVWFVNERIRRWHEGQYPSERRKFHVVQ